MPLAKSLIAARPIFSAATTIAVVGAVTILGAWVFQYGLGFAPCPLCLEQRYAYYFAVPLAVLVALGDQAGASRKVLIAACVVLAAGMIWNAGLGIYHSGIEWRWWPGPQECLGRACGPRLSRRAHGAAQVDHGGALRRGRLAFPRSFACRLQRGDLGHAGGCCGMGSGARVASAARTLIAPATRGLSRPLPGQHRCA